MSSSTNTADGFQHEPLADPKTHIRLLKITEGRLGQRVTCTLTIWPLEEAPPYTAISYTWGDLKNLATIFIDGKPKVVRQNCEYVLHQAWGVNADDLYWVDALCIDQSLKEEKNHQVAMMGDLYRNAARVLACVGDHSGDSEFLMRILETHKAYFTRGKGTVFPNIHKIPYRWTGRSTSFETFSSFRDVLVRVDLFNDRGRISRAYIQLLQRPYFSRVWILQELYLGGGKIEICCDMHHQPLANLYVLGLLVEGWLYGLGIASFVVDLFQRLSSLGSLRSLDMAVPSQLVFLYIDRQAQRSSLATGAGIVTGPKKLPQLLEFMEDFHCEDPRDRIYGIRSLIDWQGQAAPFPDYGKDAFSLAVEVMGVIKALPEWGLGITTNGFNQARRLRRCLAFSTENSLLQDAIRRRRPGLICQYRMPKSYPGPNQGEFLWCGETLGRNYKLEDRDTHVQIRSRQNEIVALGPKDTQLGDWFLTNDVSPQMASHITLLGYKFYAKQYPWSPGLVIRVARNGVCSIIGPAFCPLSWAVYVKLQDPKIFVFWWDSEDILVLEWRYSQYDKHEEVAKQRDNCFGLRATVSPESTMVKGPFEPQEIQAEISKGAERMFLESDYKDWRR
ncbi:heterokaryon incompatibility protein-domain-containing protein [Paraphoma chrysanthemicola]|nr:heterokaryon incompatibility protein-domain-containing protein [Paraphoma chrysanthemicola]